MHLNPNWLLGEKEEISINAYDVILFYFFFECFRASLNQPVSSVAYSRECTQQRRWLKFTPIFEQHIVRHELNTSLCMTLIGNINIPQFHVDPSTITTGCPVRILTSRKALKSRLEFSTKNRGELNQNWATKSTTKLKAQPKRTKTCTTLYS